MCGICGFVDFKSSTDLNVLNEMTLTLSHRGPDDYGVNIHDIGNATIGLGHTRLSIIDLSSLGHQPMDYKEYSIIYNGEIYNFDEIKTKLVSLGHSFITNTDTEVILHSFEEWGFECIQKFIGMFAFVIFNKTSSNITIFRDRAGVKPLYYYRKDNLFLFASELKAFHKHPGFKKVINNNSTVLFMDLGYIPSPYCIFDDCFKLEAGHYLNFNLNNKKTDIVKYWDIMDFYKLPKLKVSYDVGKNEVEKLLKSACEYRMVSDVPVGVFLSGGIDSSTVAALLQQNRKDKIKTFTIGFNEGNNEAPFAKDIANYLGTDHTEYYCTTKEAKKIIKELPFYYDEPFADSSAIPTILVCKMAKEKVTVALSADAGDEIFAGYTIHKTFQNHISLINRIPQYFYKISSFILKCINFFVSRKKYKLKHKIDTLIKILNSDKKDVYQILHQSYFSLGKTLKSKLFLNKIKYSKTIFDYDFSKFERNLSIPLAIDYSIYLQNNILTKVDRASMSVSLEGREPFLDHRLVEYVAQLPMNFKYGVSQKKILKDILYKYIPEELMDRPKTGFTIPIYTWLKTDLKYLLEENLNFTAINESGIFNPIIIDELKSDFFNNKLENPEVIWKILQFQLWYKKWMN